MQMMETKLRDTNEVLSSKLQVIQVLQSEMGNYIQQYLRFLSKMGQNTGEWSQAVTNIE